MSYTCQQRWNDERNNRADKRLGPLLRPSRRFDTKGSTEWHETRTIDFHRRNNLRGRQSRDVVSDDIGPTPRAMTPINTNEWWNRSFIHENSHQQSYIHLSVQKTSSGGGRRRLHVICIYIPSNPIECKQPTKAGPFSTRSWLKPSRIIFRSAAACLCETLETKRYYLLAVMLNRMREQHSLNSYQSLSRSL